MATLALVAVALLAVVLVAHRVRRSLGEELAVVAFLVLLLSLVWSLLRLYVWAWRRSINFARGEIRAW